MNKINLIIKYKEEHYWFGNIELHFDGSMYFILPKFNQKKRKISVHTSGRINYDLSVKKTIYIEPLYALTQNTMIGGLYLPSIFCCLNMLPKVMDLILLLISRRG